MARAPPKLLLPSKLLGTKSREGRGRNSKSKQSEGLTIWICGVDVENDGAQQLHLVHDRQALQAQHVQQRVLVAGPAGAACATALACC